MTEREFMELMHWLGVELALAVAAGLLILVWGALRGKYGIALIALLGIFAVLSLVPFDWRLPAEGSNYMTLRPFRFGDASRNILMYVPLGVLLGLMARSRSPWPVFSVGLLIAVGVSLIFECAQLFVGSRVPAINDLINNGVGGALGLWLARCEFWRHVTRVGRERPLDTVT